MHNHNDKKKSSKKKSSTAGGAKGFASSLLSSTKDSFPYAGTIRPGKQSPQRVVVPTEESKILLPDYALDGRPKKTGNTLLPWVIEVKTDDEIFKMREAGKLARQVLDMAGRAVAPGVTTDEIDALVHDAIVSAGAYPSPLNYHGKMRALVVVVSCVFGLGVTAELLILIFFVCTYFSHVFSLFLPCLLH
jgi:methionyl aminopeptidase